MLRFDWDLAKAAANDKKHGIAFAEAATASGDPLSITVPDLEHSQGEARFILVGLTFRGRLVVVAHAEIDETIRIISARLATRAERQSYEQEA